jgi:hypothetical protein
MIFGANTTASHILPAILSLKLTLFSPEPFDHSSTTGTTTIDATNTALRSVASQTALPISTPQSSSNVSSSITLPSSISSITATHSNTSTSASQSTSTKPTLDIYTAVLPAIFGALILISCILLFRRYRRHHGNKTTSEPSALFKAWLHFSSPSPSPKNHTLGPDDSLSQRHLPDRGRPRYRDGSEARRSSLLRKARERFLARERAMGMSQV